MIKRLFVFLCGLICVFLFIEAGLRIVNLEKLFRRREAQRSFNSPSDNARREIRLVCIGESMTVSLGYESYPSQLERLLNDESPQGYRFTVINRGLACTTSRANLEELEDNIETYRPSAVVAMIGINDLNAPLVKEHIDVHFGKKFWRKSRALHLLSSLLFSAKKKEEKNVRTQRLTPESYYETIRRSYQPGWDRHKLHSLLLADAQAAGVERAALFWKLCSLLDQVRCSEAFLIIDQLLASDVRDAFTVHACALGLVCSFLAGDKDGRAEEFLEKCIDAAGSDAQARTIIGRWCVGYGCYVSAESMFRETLAIDGRNVEALTGLGNMFFITNRHSQALVYLNQALEVDPDNLEALSFLALVLQEKDADRCLKTYEKILKLDPESVEALRFIGKTYLWAKRYREAMALFERCMSLLPMNDKGERMALRMCYARLGIQDKTALAREDFVSRYRRIRDICRRAGVKLICMQYPRRSIDALKSVFADDPDGISFVDNEASFDAAFRNGAKYDDLFIDSFAGDFGHCTILGNSIMARNAAHAVLDFINRESGR